jgi:hypothetical protein
MDTEYTKAFKAGYDFGYKDAANENRYNTGVKVGIAYEQDRIIELLQNTPLQQDDAITKEFANGAIWAMQQIIELIKGKA